MSEIASKGQLRLSLLRWVMVTVPSIEFLGIASSTLAGDISQNRWYATLVLSPAQPPAWAFALVWPILYLLMGVALAMVINARGARGRRLAITAFLLQLACNLAWSPLFFARHEVTLAFYLILIILALATAATLLFGRIRPLAAWAMVPYLCWLGFAAGLAYDVHRLNPEAETLVAPAAHTQI